MLKGYTQSPIQGVSMRYTFDSPKRRRPETTQYYEMLGTRGIWHEGWKAVTRHAPNSGKGHFDQDEWELYHTDVTARKPMTWPTGTRRSSRS